MKIWRGYGSDHSSNLVMIGEFKTEMDAERAYNLVETISELARRDLDEGVLSSWEPNERMSEETEESLRDLRLHSLSPADIADFALLNPSLKRVGKVLEFRTDDVEIGGFVKLLVHRGAKVQVYSADDYPDAKEDA